VSDIPPERNDPLTQAAREYHQRLDEHSSAFRYDPLRDAARRVIEAYRKTYYAQRIGTGARLELRHAIDHMEGLLQRAQYGQNPTPANSPSTTPSPAESSPPPKPESPHPE
jgi:hypothetical protein